MKKYKLFSGEEIKPNEAFKYKKEFTSNDVNMEFDINLKLTQEEIDDLVKLGVIEEIETKEKIKDLKYYMDKVDAMAGKNFMKTLIALNPASAFSLLLKKVAIDMDKKYDDHISNYAIVYIINLMTGKVFRVYTHLIKSYKALAMFRTTAEAYEALGILKPVFDKIYEQENKECNPFNF